MKIGASGYSWGKLFGEGLVEDCNHGDALLGRNLLESLVSGLLDAERAVAFLHGCSLAQQIRGFWLSPGRLAHGLHTKGSGVSW